MKKPKYKIEIEQLKEENSVLDAELVSAVQRKRLADSEIHSLSKQLEALRSETSAENNAMRSKLADVVSLFEVLAQSHATYSRAMSQYIKLRE